MVGRAVRVSRKPYDEMTEAKRHQDLAGSMAGWESVWLAGGRAGEGDEGNLMRMCARERVELLDGCAV